MSTSLIWGFSVMISLNTFAAISGGYMSPLITLATYVHNILDLTVRKSFQWILNCFCF
jgi:glycerol uptake facilitator-like aquaporin